MYTTTNFKTKKAFKDAVAAGERITIYQPGPFGSIKIHNGTYSIEGPHSPEPHRWYARARVEDGIVVRVQ